MQNRRSHRTETGVKSVVRTTEVGYRAEIVVERALLSDAGVRGSTPVQAALLIPDDGFIRREQIVQTDDDPRTRLCIKL